MLDKARTLQRYKLSSANGEIGTVKTFYFDDQHWTIRYLVADTGAWLAGRQVLISPYALAGVSRERHRFVLDLTKGQIEEGPSLSSEQPISQQFEEAYHGFHGWPRYWCGPYTWGRQPHIERDRKRWRAAPTDGRAWQRQLRTTSDVNGYYIQATDGEMGHIEDFIIDEETWAIRYLVVSTRNWWPGRRVLVSPQWIQRVNWDAGEVFVTLSGETVRESPEYTDQLLVTRDYETRLHRHYHRQGYWFGDPDTTDQVQ